MRAEFVKGMEREVKALEELLSICSNCKKIRDEKETWQPLKKRSVAQCTHRMCPDCMQSFYGS